MAKGLPGLRDVWDGVSWIKDQVGDALGGVADVVMSPFVDSEGAIFGLFDLKDLKSAYKKSKERAQAGSRGFFDVPAITQQMLDEIENQGVVPTKIANNEQYPLQDHQQNAQGIDTVSITDSLVNQIRRGLYETDMNFMTVRSNPQGTNLHISDQVKWDNIPVLDVAPRKEESWEEWQKRLNIGKE
jgi:hypothetical protein